MTPEGICYKLKLRFMLGDRISNTDAKRRFLNDCHEHIRHEELLAIPQNYITLTDETDIKNMEKLIDLLEDNDDVQNVYHNWEA